MEPDWASQNPHNTQNPEPPPTLEVQTWPIDRLVFYARNPRKNDAAVDRMCSSIREFGFKIPVLARSDGTLVTSRLKQNAHGRPWRLGNNNKP